MYCRKCGNELEPDAAFCTNCGIKLDQQKMQHIENKNDRRNQIRYDTETNVKSNVRNNRKMVRVSKKIILSVILVIGFICLVTGTVIKKTGVTNSAREIALSSTEYLMEGKTDKYYKLLAMPYKEYMCGDDGWYNDEEEFKKDIEDITKEKKQTMISDCGEPVKIKYEVDDTIDCDAEQLNAVRSELARDYDYNPDDIQEAMVVSVAINATGPDGQSNWKNQCGCVKIHGKWYVHRPGFESIS